MDNTEYELLSRVGAGEAVFVPATGGDSTWRAFEYLVARLLQLRARGLVRFAAAPEGDCCLTWACHLTGRGRTMLDHHRVSLSEKPADRWDDSGLMSRPDRRRARLAPRAKLWPGRLGFYPALCRHAWYRLHTLFGPDPVYVWLETAHGMIRVQRADVELRGV